ncbi:MAG: hypothetical protein V3T98_01730 [Candidatus Paceibacterota bacterium]
MKRLFLIGILVFVFGLMGCASTNLPAKFKKVNDNIVIPVGAAFSVDVEVDNNISIPEKEIKEFIGFLEQSIVEHRYTVASGGYLLKIKIIKWENRAPSGIFWYIAPYLTANFSAEIEVVNKLGQLIANGKIDTEFRSSPSKTPLWIAGYRLVFSGGQAKSIAREAFAELIIQGLNDLSPASVSAVN